MVEFSWNDGENKRLAVYNAENVDKKSIIDKYLDFDFVEFWYPRCLDEDILDFWEKDLIYIHYRQEWNDSSYTNIINLEEDIEILYSRFNKESRYEVRKALQGDKIHFINIQNPSEKEINNFIFFYNEFADSKDLPHISETKLNGIIQKKALSISCAYSEKNVLLCMHSYICDANSRRAILYTSASDYHNKVDNKERQLIGRANRALHYNDILHLKTVGMSVYDFGGTYLGNENVDLKNISVFKQSFGGKTEESRASIVVPLKSIREAKAGLEEIITSGKLNGNKQIIIFGFGIVGKYAYYELKKRAFFVYRIIDNNKQNFVNNDINLYKQDILASVVATKVMLLCTTSKVTYESLLKTFETYGFCDGINCFLIRK